MGPSTFAPYSDTRCPSTYFPTPSKRRSLMIHGQYSPTPFQCLFGYDTERLLLKGW